jgi:hypothetical protein
LGQPESNRLGDVEIDERAAEAQAILDSKAFNEAVQGAYSRVLGTLLNADVGSLTAGQAHATLKAIQEVRKQLELFVTERKMRKFHTRKGNNDGGWPGSSSGSV